jgi:hypothetical protein
MYVWHPPIRLASQPQPQPSSGLTRCAVAGDCPEQQVVLWSCRVAPGVPFVLSFAAALCVLCAVCVCVCHHNFSIASGRPPAPAPRRFALSPHPSPLSSQPACARMTSGYRPPTGQGLARSAPSGKFSGFRCRLLDSLLFV